MDYDITASIVTFNTKQEDLKKIISSFFNTKLKTHMYISDNSPEDSLRKFIEELNNEEITYIFNNKNGGYGWGHNRVIEKIKNSSKYHLILNPDINFKKNALEKIYAYMEQNPKVGQVMPMIKYPNGEIQYLCKQIPTPKDLFLRKFCPIKSIVQKNDYRYEMRETGYDRIMEVPILSGCFMFLRTKSFIEAGGFDERYFMYMEDFDLTRKIGEKYKTIFYPEVEVIHNHAKESYKNKKMMLIHISSAIKYFNKWGWFFDSCRTKNRYLGETL